MRHHALLRAAPAAFLVVALAGLTACASYGHRRYGRVQSPYETMRSMAFDLDQQAHRAASRAVAMDRRGDRDREVAERMMRFAGKAEDFRRKVDRRGHDDADDVGDDLRDLEKEAQKVTDEMRKARTSDRTWNDWDRVLDTLRGMDRAAADYAADLRHRDRDWRR